MISDEVEVIDEKNSEPIEALYVYVSIDDDDNEGVCSTEMEGLGHFPLVFGYECMARKMLPLAEMLANRTGKQIKLVRFTSREEVLTVSRTRSGSA